MKVLVIGAGRFGKALGGVLEENGNTVRYFDPKVFPENSLAGELKGAEVMVFAAPSVAAEEMADKLPKDLPLIFTAKGFWNEGVFREFRDFSVMAGAAYAEDIVDAEPKFGNRNSQKNCFRRNI